MGKRGRGAAFPPVDRRTRRSVSSPQNRLWPPDLSLSKTHTGTLTQGAKGVTYSLLVTNDGSGPSAGTVIVRDVLPDGLTPVGVSGDGWDCAIDEQTVEAVRGVGPAVAPRTVMRPVGTARRERIPAVFDPEAT